MRRCLQLGLLLSCALTARCGGAPTAPERYENPLILVTCGRGTAASLHCTALVPCASGSCRPGTPPDVTATATWTTDDPSVARVTGPGALVAVGPGYTTVRAAYAGISGGAHSLAVFAGTPPLPVFALQGSVREGTAPSDPKIDGATIEVLDGLIAGRTARSGMPADAVPGLSLPPISAPGLFRIEGVPPGTMRLRVTKDGYLPVERDVTFELLGGPATFDVLLHRP